MNQASAEVDGMIARALSDNATVLAALKDEVHDAHSRASGIPKTPTGK